MYKISLHPNGMFQYRENIEEMDIGIFDEKNMATHGVNRNLQRDIPLFFDNLKTVHRRLLFAMADMGLFHNKPYVKCAGVIGRTIEKYHPHGDTAAYEALIFMGQPWRMLVPLVSIRGNYANAKNSTEYAQMRYVECKLTKFAEDCFFSEWDFKSNLVDMKPTFNGADYEPLYLPAKYPFFLMSWGSGMGFAVSTKRPGFLPQDAMQAVIDLIKDKNANIVLYPEDPLGCTIIGKKVFKKFVDYDFKKNNDDNLKYVVRADYRIEKHMDKMFIRVLNTPYEVNPIKIIDRITEVVNAGKLDGIAHIEVKLKAGSIPQLPLKSDTAELIIEMKKGFDPHILMDKLYRMTDLECTFPLNCVYVNTNRNVKYNLRESILTWIKLRKKLLKRMYRLKVNDYSKRIYVLNALISIFDKNGIEEVIDIIRFHKRDVAIEKLITKFNISDYQAKEISNMKLRDLSDESYKELVDERKTTIKKLDDVREILKNKSNIDKIIISQMQEGIEKYSRVRQSKVIDPVIDDSEDKFFNIEVTNNGYIRKVSVDKQDKIILAEEDDMSLVSKFTNIADSNKLFLFTDTGQVYSENIRKLRISKTEGLGNLLKYKQSSVTIVSSAAGKEESKNSLIFVTKNGLIKRTNLDAYFISSQGSTAIKLIKGDELVKVIDVNNQDSKGKVIIYTKQGKANMFDISEITVTSRATVGTMGIKLDPDDQVIGMELVKPSDDHIITISELGHVKKFSLENTFTTSRRGNSGISIIHSNETLHRLIAVSQKVQKITFDTFQYTEELDATSLKSKTRLSSGDKILRGRRKREVITKE